MSAGRALRCSSRAGSGSGPVSCFVRSQLRRRYPLFDVRVMARPAVAAGAVAILYTYVAFMGTMFPLPQYLQYVQDRSVVAAGLLLVPLGVGTAIGARYNARVFAKLGPRLTVAGGCAGLAASIAVFLLLRRDTTVVLVLVGTGLIGVIIALGVPPATAVIMMTSARRRPETAAPSSPASTRTASTS
jgi:predicted MFS family arabinose efflux permease